MAAFPRVLCGLPIPQLFLVVAVQFFAPSYFVAAQPCALNRDPNSVLHSDILAAEKLQDDLLSVGGLLFGPAFSRRAGRQRWTAQAQTQAQARGEEPRVLASVPSVGIAKEDVEAAAQNYLESLGEHLAGIETWTAACTHRLSDIRHRGQDHGLKSDCALVYLASEVMATVCNVLSADVFEEKGYTAARQAEHSALSEALSVEEGRVEKLEHVLQTVSRGGFADVASAEAASTRFAAIHDAFHALRDRLRSGEEIFARLGFGTARIDRYFHEPFARVMAFYRNRTRWFDIWRAGALSLATSLVDVASGLYLVHLAERERVVGRLAGDGAVGSTELVRDSPGGGAVSLLEVRRGVADFEQDRLHDDFNSRANRDREVFEVFLVENRFDYRACMYSSLLGAEVAGRVASRIEDVTVGATGEPLSEASSAAAAGAGAPKKPLSPEFAEARKHGSVAASLRKSIEHCVIPSRVRESVDSGAPSSASYGSASKVVSAHLAFLKIATRRNMQDRCGIHCVVAKMFAQLSIGRGTYSLDGAALDEATEESALASYFDEAQQLLKEVDLSFFPEIGGRRRLESYEFYETTAGLSQLEVAMNEAAVKNFCRSMNEIPFFSLLSEMGRERRAELALAGTGAGSARSARSARSAKASMSSVTFLASVHEITSDRGGKRFLPTSDGPGPPETERDFRESNVRLADLFRYFEGWPFLRTARTEDSLVGFHEWGWPIGRETRTRGCMFATAAPSWQMLKPASESQGEGGSVSERQKSKKNSEAKQERKKCSSEDCFVEYADISKEQWAPMQHALAGESVDLYSMAHHVGRVLDEFNVLWWVVGGTMLGAVRHGGLMRQECDVDMAIPEIFLPLFVGMPGPNAFWASGGTADGSRSSDRRGAAKAHFYETAEQQAPVRDDGPIVRLEKLGLNVEWNPQWQSMRICPLHSAGAYSTLTTSNYLRCVGQAVDVKFVPILRDMQWVLPKAGKGSALRGLNGTTHFPPTFNVTKMVERVSLVDGEVPAASPPDEEGSGRAAKQPGGGEEQVLGLGDLRRQGVTLVNLEKDAVGVPIAFVTLGRGEPAHSTDSTEDAASALAAGSSGSSFLAQERRRKLALIAQYLRRSYNTPAPVAVLPSSGDDKSTRSSKERTDKNLLVQVFYIEDFRSRVAFGDYASILVPRRPSFFLDAEFGTDWRTHVRQHGRLSNMLADYAPLYVTGNHSMFWGVFSEPSGPLRVRFD